VNTPSIALRQIICLAAVLLLSGAGMRAQEPPKTPAPKASGSSALERISKEGERAREEHRVDDAIALYKKGIALKPNWDEGWWYVGSLYYDLDQYEAARDAFRHLTNIAPNTAIGWGMLGLCEFQTRQYNASLTHIRQAVELGVSADQTISDVIHYHFALLLTRYEHYEDAMKALSAFAQRNLNQPDYVEAMGLAALRKPLLPSELPPTEREVVMDVGRTLYDATALKTNEAALEFKILLEKYPSEPNIHYLYGSFLMYSDANEGLAELKKELEISPVHVPALVTIAAEYVHRQDFKPGLPYAEKAVSIDPQSFAAHAVLGRVLTEGDIDLPRGLKELEYARQLAPASPQVRIALATAYTKAGRKDDAARERQEFLRLRKITDANEATFQ
jgi:tetratricopeptide (TPR) repeat protein